ncbi:MAG: bifunctional DNA-formamidopyrimidine glycosylase/DNA-(apurinic or apyrimidinic site) lyase [Gammaproteobacteria bacterium]
MPELPEVETTRRGTAPHVRGRVIEAVTVRNRQLRWPVPRGLAKTLIGQRIRDVDRRGKYLLFRLDEGTLILHLGMSGSLRIVAAGTAHEKHDHVDIDFDNRICLRFRDPRRFGSIHYTREDPCRHPLLASLGPEPLDDGFDGEYLHARSRNRKQAVKTFLMDSRVVTGVGNIYASEALFLAGIHPKRPAGRISLQRYRALADAAKLVLTLAIEKGGTTLRDFTSGEGNPGYFRQELNVYDRESEDCRLCGSTVRQMRIGQRSSYYCSRCQT